MSWSNQSIQSYYRDFLRCARCSHDFEYENPLYHPITLPTCHHTMCRKCINIIRNETKCPQDQISFEINHTPIDQLPTNYPLLMSFYDSSKLPKDKETRHGRCAAYVKLDIWKQNDFHINGRRCLLIFSRSTIRKVFNLLNIQVLDCKNHLKVLKAINNLAEHICICFILHYQDRQKLIKNILVNIGLKDHQYLQPNMIEEILKSILLLVQQPSILSRKHLVHAVLQKISGNNWAADKFIVECVIDLRFRASCFEEKRHDNLSSLHVKDEYKMYENLRYEFDSIFIEINIKAELNISPEEWSSLLYGHIQHESIMEIIVKKYLTSDSYAKSIKTLSKALEHVGVEQTYVLKFEDNFNILPNIGLASGNNEENKRSPWVRIAFVFKSFEEDLKSLPYFHQQQLATNVTNDGQSNDLLLTKGTSLTLY
ncbi:unnamed protein product [Rotaria sordida]|uniref:RING-type E3 ubiquitin transferase n=1 Tax=Rotaria sordida TaxID=392033 RepID=A0A813S8X4_9BILA|nr:unnamed protein product [Rotaria sordida]CAF0966979.1 unnamed protein product [Rotaria sordida]